MEQENQNTFVAFLKSILPMAMAIGIQLAVQMAVIGGVYVYVLGTTKVGSDSGLAQQMMQDRFNAIIGDGNFLQYLQLGTMIPLALVFIIWFFSSSVSKDMTPLKKALPFKNIVLIVVAGYLAQLGMSMLLTVILPLFPKIMENYSHTIESLTGGDNIFIIILVTVILAPIAEELIFRGLTMRSSMRSWKNFMLVNFLQALYFGVYHMQIVQSVYAFFLGLIFGYVAYKLNNVFASMLFHAAVNGSAMLLLLPPSLFDHPVLMLLIGVACMAVIWALMYLLEAPAPVKKSTGPRERPLRVPPYSGSDDPYDNNGSNF